LRFPVPSAVAVVAGLLTAYQRMGGDCRSK
jgi:hypothetical protein